MMGLIDRYIDYVENVRRYSPRTVAIYSEVLADYANMIAADSEKDGTDGLQSVSDEELVSSLNPSELRSYQVHLLDSKRLSPKTVNLHISVMSGFCQWLLKAGLLNSNPVKLIPRPKIAKRLPVFYKKDSIQHYFDSTAVWTSQEMLDAFVQCPDTNNGKELYTHRLDRLIISMLFGLGIRRAELISMNIGDVDFGRKVAKVHGKGDKMREIPLIVSLCEEILLYLKAVERMMGGQRSLNEPLLVTYTGKRLYPVYVDKAVKSQLEGAEGVTGRKSPHVLRHSLATELLDEGADLNSIKELLGHASLAATQVYTHNTIAKLKTIYQSAHPRAKNGGKHGD